MRLSYVVRSFRISMRPTGVRQLRAIARLSCHPRILYLPKSPVRVLPDYAAVFSD